MSQQINTGLEFYLKKQIAMAQRETLSVHHRCLGNPYQHLCDTLKRVLENNPQTRIALDGYAHEGMKQLLSNDTLLRQNGINTGKGGISFDNFSNITGKIVNSTGVYCGYRQYDLYIDADWNNGVARWKGKNDKWYMEKVEGKVDFFGNQYTGARRDIISKATKYKKFGEGLFWIGTVISVAQAGIAFSEKDKIGIAKSGVDIVIGVIATYGGPPGWFVGGVYLFLDLFGAFEGKHFRTLSPYANNPYVQLRDKTYVKSPMVLPPIKRKIMPRIIPEFRQGYKRY